MNADSVSIGPLSLPGALTLTPGAIGLVVFAHGSGSSRNSPRNRSVAQVLQRGRCATLLFDLLTDAEAASRENVFDIEMLAQRVEQALDWARASAALARLPIGLFGASTGAAAALVVCAQRPGGVAALVSRGGRPDLAGSALGDVRTPTMLIVGGFDADVLQLNRLAFTRLKCEKRFEVIPRATHLFAEAGALETVAELAREWFTRHFGGGSAADA
jgi:putative phosphoribosyl transferase